MSNNPGLIKDDGSWERAILQMAISGFVKNGRKVLLVTSRSNEEMVSILTELNIAPESNDVTVMNEKTFERMGRLMMKKMGFEEDSIQYELGETDE